MGICRVQRGGYDKGMGTGMSAGNLKCDLLTRKQGKHLMMILHSKRKEKQVGC